MQKSRLPLFGGLVPVVWCVSYALTALTVGAIVGRQSSTSGIGPSLILIAALPLALVGASLARLAARVLHRERLEWFASSTKWPPLLLAGIATLASLQAAVPILIAAHDAIPRVIVDSVQFDRRNASLPADGVTHGVRVYDLGKASDPLSWGEWRARFTPTAAGDELEVGFEPAGDVVRIPLRGIDYAKFVDAVAFKMNADDSPSLALLITGRASGQRDLLAVISDTRELVYLELLDRHWNFRAAQLAVASTPGGEQIFVGAEPRSMLAFTLQPRATRTDP